LRLRQPKGSLLSVGLIIQNFYVEMRIKKNKNLEFVDLFAGCGGLSLGLELASFEPIFVNELNQSALETYLINRDRNFPLLRSRYNLSDIKKLVASKGQLLADLIQGFKKDFGVDVKTGGLNLLVGGPPCQGFSGLGHRRSYSVSKSQLPSNHLYQDMAFVISALNPKIFLFENVKGLLTARWSQGGDKGEIWEDVKDTFKNIAGYKVHAELVHAKNYGVPQSRPRVLIVGIRDDLNFKEDDSKFAKGFLPAPSPIFLNLEDVLGDLIDEKYSSGGITTKYPEIATNNYQKWFRTNRTTGEVASKNSPVTEHEYSRHHPDIVKKFRHMIANGGVIPNNMKTKKFSQRLLPAKWGVSGPTITVTSMPDDYVHFSQPRTLTVREWARLQTFPDWYQFAGVRTTGGVRRAGNPLEGIFEREVPKYTQIGNAVPVALAAALGNHFKKILNS
jgi:DNA (cytosine-5)-methyltransferase 1